MISRRSFLLGTAAVAVSASAVRALAPPLLEIGTWEGIRFAEPPNYAAQFLREINEMRRSIVPPLPSGDYVMVVHPSYWRDLAA